MSTRRDGAVDAQHLDGHDLTAAYALDAVDDAERARAEEHLAACVDCRADLARVRAALLEAVAPVAPQPGSKAAVMSRLDDVQQLPPVADPAGRAAPSAPSAAPIDELAARRARRSRALTGWVAAAAVAALVVVGGGLGATAAHLRSERDAARAQSTALVQVAGAADARTVAATGDTDRGWSHASVVVSRTRQRAVLMPSGAPSAGSGHTWELWYVTDGRARPAGVMSSGSTTARTLAGRTGAATVVAVTREPAAGSKTPTTTPVATFSLPA